MNFYYDECETHYLMQFNALFKKCKVKKERALMMS